ncbi:hypothetical protein L3X37_15205 [Sabulilitoribacter arenilitoris]|uniref:Lipocalin-like domain-containing protein n=1 Tax=Wocania arenilitoris TaxID=2044858 RepID=A0AAE3JLX1_9FLAO|nr:hypothetical protein [Wocania arenilitoris]MCF7569693.1 hypothetical protein [Wocania arenilitoris]
MKKIKLFCGILLGLVFLSSCSSSDDSDIIIGKWRAIEKYESNQQIDLPTCLPHIYTEYKADNTVSGGKIISDNFPEECNLLDFDGSVVWKNLGNSMYRIGHINDQGTTYKIYKEGVNLVEESSNGITKIVYEPN